MRNLSMMECNHISGGQVTMSHTIAHHCLMNICAIGLLGTTGMLVAPLLGASFATGAAIGMISWSAFSVMISISTNTASFFHQTQKPYDLFRFLSS